MYAVFTRESGIENKSTAAVNGRHFDRKGHDEAPIIQSRVLAQFPS